MALMEDINADVLEVDNSLIDAKLKDIIQNVESIANTYLQGLNAETLTELTQQQYTGYLRTCALSFFRPTKCLYKHTQQTTHDGLITCMYDDDLIEVVCDYYISLSERHNKISNLYGFSVFIGCDDDTLQRWEGLENQRPKACATVKRLRKTYERGLENGAQSGKNPVGFIATLNHRFGWAQDNKPRLTVNINRTQQEIMSTFDTSLISDKSENQP